MANGRDPAFLAQYEALTAGVGLARHFQRTQVELTGRDRATFLNNFCTNDVRRLEPGGGCEAFVTSVQGKVLGHVFVFCRPESLVIDTVPGQGAALVAHLDRYLIREQVELHDRSAEWAELLLAGPLAEQLLAQGGAALPPAGGRLMNADATLFGHAVSLRRVDVTGPDGFFISCDSSAAASTLEKLLEAGAISCDAAAVEAARIEAGFPLFGVDITDKNLPQEVGRDAQAISFTKGCYLGQETVARIDALGHVNRTLVGVRFGGVDVPPSGTELFADEQPVGAVTSAAFCPKLAAPLALAYVRRGYNTPGTPLASPQGDAQVVSLPVRGQ
jgi:tRNA-modifying protein YgfZ